MCSLCATRTSTTLCTSSSTYSSASCSLLFVRVTCRSRVITVICKKKRVTERHNRGTKRKLKSHPPPQKRREALFLLRLVRLQFSLRAPIVPLRDATFLQMTRLLQVTKIAKNKKMSPTSHRYRSISFVETSAPGGFLSSGTAVLTDFLKNHATSASH